MISKITTSVLHMDEKQQEGAKESSGRDDGAIRVAKLTLVDLSGFAYARHLDQQA